MGHYHIFDKHWLGISPLVVFTIMAGMATLDTGIANPAHCPFAFHIDAFTHDLTALVEGISNRPYYREFYSHIPCLVLLNLTQPFSPHPSSIQVSQREPRSVEPA